MSHLNLHTDKVLNKFKFPASYLNYVMQCEITSLDPWKFLCESQTRFDGKLMALRRLYPNRTLVPFAYRIDSDDVVCFDGEECSEEPLVHYVHLYATSGWEDRGSVANFNEWLKLALQEAEEYQHEE